MATEKLTSEQRAKRESFARKHPELTAPELASLARRMGVRGLDVHSVYYVRGKIKHGRGAHAATASVPAKTAESQSTQAAPVTQPAAPAHPKPRTPQRITPAIELRRLILRLGIDLAQREVDALRDLHSNGVAL